LPKADDNVFESEGVQVVVDPASLAYSTGAASTMTTASTARFEIKNPTPEHLG